MYQIRFFRDVERQLARFPKKDQDRIGLQIRGLAQNPRPPGYTHLRDVLFRIRVGNYRIIYAIYDRNLLIIVVEVARRSEVTYDDLETLIQRARRYLE